MLYHLLLHYPLIWQLQLSSWLLDAQHQFPLGPRLVFTMSAMVFAALKLFFFASLPFVSVVPSFKRRIGICGPFEPCCEDKVFPPLFWYEFLKNDIYIFPFI